MTPLQIKRHLNKSLSSELAEVLVPLINWHHTKTGVTAILPNPIWEDVFLKYAADDLRSNLESRGLKLRHRCRMHTAEQQHNIGPSFENFLHDPGNEFAISACKRVVDAPGIEHNPLYLYGPSGCGKSHLLQAIAHECVGLMGDDAVLHLHGPRFVNRDAHKLAERTENSIRNSIEAAAVIIFDDVDPLTNRSLAQEELFHLINDSLEQGKQLIFTGSLVPQKLHLEERLATRLGWGLSVGIEAPLTETRLAYLQVLAGDALSDLDKNELAQLVDTTAPNMHSILKLSERLINGEDVLRSDDQASFDSILETVAHQYAVRPGDIIGKRQTKVIVRARQAALLLGRRLTRHNLESLGGMVGGRDHSTVIYSIREAEKRIENDAQFSKDINNLTQEILSAR